MADNEETNSELYQRFKDATMEELVDALTKAEDGQQIIYQVYIKAAEKDEHYRKLKERERVIRMCIAMKVSQ